MMLVRVGMFSTLPGGPDEPDVHAEALPIRPFRWRWRITTGAAGYALTEAGAYRKAHRAAWS